MNPQSRIPRPLHRLLGSQGEKGLHKPIGMSFILAVLRQSAPVREADALVVIR